VRGSEEEIIRQHQHPYRGASLDNCWNEEKIGFPKALATLRSWPIQDLYRERLEMLKASFNPMFGMNAKKMLNLIEQVIDERGKYENHIVKSTRMYKKPSKKPAKKIAKKKRESVALIKPIIEAVLDYQKKRRGINVMTAQIAYQKLEKICNKSGIDVQDAIHSVRNMILENPSSVSKYGINVVKFL